MEDERSAEPLTLTQLKQVKEAASRLSFRHRLIAHIIPHSGLFRSEFLHLSRNWLVYLNGEDSTAIETNLTSPDAIVIHIPETSPCVGTLKFMGGNDMTLQERDMPCKNCKPSKVWTQEYGHRKGRKILVEDASAVDVLYWWFSKYDSIPFSPTDAPNDYLADIAAEAGLSRELVFTALRRTFGVVLVERGADRETVSKLMGLTDRGKTLDPLYEAAGKSMPRAQPKWVSRNELLEELRRLADELGHPPTTQEIDERGKFSRGPYLDRFDGIGDAYKAAGLDFSGWVHGSKVSEEALLEELRQVAEELGRRPSAEDINEMSEFSYTTYNSRFGGLWEAFRAAGIGDLE